MRKLLFYMIRVGYNGPIAVPKAPTIATPAASSSAPCTSVEGYVAALIVLSILLFSIGVIFIWKHVLPNLTGGKAVIGDVNNPMSKKEGQGV